MSLFFLIRLYNHWYCVDLHIDIVMTDSDMLCKFDRKVFWCDLLRTEQFDNKHVNFINRCIR